jgi:hypothetical protein
MKALVITSVAENKRDLKVVIVEYSIPIVSPVITLYDKAAYRDSNPYSVYGQSVEAWVGKGCEIVVADCRRGNLDGLDF